MSARTSDELIEILHLEDAQVLAELHGRCFERPWDAQSFANLMALPGVHVRGALVDATPAGFIMLRQAGDEAEILTICVLDTMRRRGIGGALFENACSELAGAGTLFIEVDVANEAALAFYRARGFCQTGLRKDYYQSSDGTRSDALTMALTVGSSTRG